MTVIESYLWLRDKWLLAFNSNTAPYDWVVQAEREHWNKLFLAPTWYEIQCCDWVISGSMHLAQHKKKDANSNVCMCDFAFYFWGFVYDYSQSDRLYLRTSALDARRSRPCSHAIRTPILSATAKVHSLWSDNTSAITWTCWNKNSNIVRLWLMTWLSLLRWCSAEMKKSLAA